MKESEHQTDFLAQCLRHDTTGEIYEHEQKITGLEAEERCLRRSVWMMGVLTGFALIGIGYTFFVLENLPTYKYDAIIQAFSVVGTASAMCWLAFGGLLIARRYKLGQQREQARHLVIKLLAGRLDPHIFGASVNPRDGVNPAANVPLVQPVLAAPSSNPSRVAA